MDVRYNKRNLVDLVELKDNLRLDRGFELFDKDLLMKLAASVKHAGAFIGRDLDQTPVYSYPFAGETAINIDPALCISSVKVGEAAVAPDKWEYADGVLKITGEYAETDDVEVETAYNADIKIAVLMHASSLWLNPADSVETLPKASTNLLSQYRHYDGR